jgi:heat shock protein HslJ
MNNHENAERPDESLTNTYWKLVEVDGAPITAQENFREAHMVLHLDASRLAGSTGCNTLTGRYQVKNTRIAFNQVATTKMACPTAPMKTEQDFLTALKQANAWHVEGARLELLDDNDAPLASFQAVHLY